MAPRHLYVHVPFCARRCVYCDFAIAVRPVAPLREFTDAVARELARVEAMGPLETIYLGGGTPSRLGADGIAAILDAIRDRADFAPDAEVTLEANPDDVNPEALQGWRSAGVNRLSLGVQSFDDDVLRWMHRTHNAADARRAVADAQEQGIGNVSVDLIFAVPHTLRREWSRDLDAALALDVPHVSVYGLTAEPRTPFGRWVARGDVAEAPEDSFASEFLLAHDVLTAAGYAHYEVSNYGRPDRQSRHNWAYWQRRPYVGIGPSAHEFNGTSRRWNVEAYAQWLATVASGADPIDGSERLSEEEVAAEVAYLNLRTTQGVDASGVPRSTVDSWITAGWAVYGDGARLRLTPSGWLRLDSLAAALTASGSHF